MRLHYGSYTARLWTLLFLGIGFWLVMSSVVPVLVRQLAEGVLGIPYPDLWATDSPEPSAAQTGVIAANLIASQVLAFGLTAVVVARLDGRPRELLLWHRRPDGLQIGLGVLIMLLALPLVQWLSLDPGEGNYLLPERFQEVEDKIKAIEERSMALIKPMLRDFPALAFVTIAIFPAVMEELFFRGFLQQTLRPSLNLHVTVWVVGLVFSLFHAQLYGLLSRWLLGVILGYLVLWSGSIWPAIAAHFANNALNAVVAYFQFNGRFDTTALAQEGAGAVDWRLALPSAALVAAGLFYYQRLQPALPPARSALPTAAEAPMDAPGEAPAASPPPEDRPSDDKAPPASSPAGNSETHS